MLPAFTKEGYLPPGIYEIELDELQQRFAYTPWRKELFDNLVRLINDLKKLVVQLFMLMEVTPQTKEYQAILMFVGKIKI